MMSGLQNLTGGYTWHRVGSTQLNDHELVVAVASTMAQAEQRFFAALRDLVLRAGEPSSRSIATAIGGVSHTTVNLAIRGTKVPSWPITAKLVEHLGGDVEQFRSLWVETREPLEKKPTSQQPEVSVFVSYAHIDDEATYGRITKLINDIANMYRSMTGQAVGVFQDVDSISPGENWKDRIRLGLSDSSILLAFVTPAYLRSTYCREELSEFLAFLDANSSVRLIIPLIYASPDRIDDKFADDKLWQKLSMLQRVDISSLRSVDPGSSDWIVRVEELADTVDRTLAEVSLSLDNAKATKQFTSDENDDELPEGLLERMARVEEAMPGMVESLEKFSQLLGRVGEETENTTPQMNEAETFGDKLRVSNQLAKRLSPIAADMEFAADSLMRDFEELNIVISYILKHARENPEETTNSPEAISTLRDLWNFTEVGSTSLSQLNEMNKALTSGIGYSKNLDRPLKAMRRAFLRLADLRGIISGWRDDLSALGSTNPGFLGPEGE